MNKKDSFGLTMLHWASLSNQWETVEMLLKEFKAEVDCLTLDEVTPLMLAASHGHKKVIRILLDHGADIKKEDNNKHHNARSRAFRPSIRKILSRHAFGQNIHFLRYGFLNEAIFFIAINSSCGFY